MPTLEIVKAWKDEEYWDTLTAEQRAELPLHPAGLIEFEQPQLEDETLFEPAAHKCGKFSCFNSNYTKEKAGC